MRRRRLEGQHLGPTAMRRAPVLAAAILTLALLGSWAMADRAGGSAVAATMSGSGSLSALGAPDHIGYAVDDLDAVKSQFAAATGTQFGPVVTSTAQVDLPGHDSVTVQFRRTFSVRGAPFVEFVEASPAIGPWSASPSHSSHFISYAVDDVAAAGVVLEQAGMTQAAVSGQSFAIWVGAEDILVKLVDNDLVPEVGGVNESQAAIDLGPLVATSHAACDIGAVRTQLSNALGVSWKLPLTAVLVGDYAGRGILPIIAQQLSVSREGPPHLVLEKVTPHDEPFTCGRPHLHLSVPNVHAAADQMAQAGMRRVLTVVPDIAAVYEGEGGILIEAINGVVWLVAGDVL